MEKHILLDCIDKKLSEEDAGKVLDWIDENPANIRQLAEMDDIITVGRMKRIREEKEAEKSFDRYFQRAKFPKWLAILIPCAAVLAAAMIFIPLAVPSEDREPVIVSVAPGEAPKDVKLPDGTLVWLNSDSSLSIGEFDDDGIRQVWLTGEAYFNVTHDVSRPFAVNTSDYRIRVLGTSFNVSSYSSDPVSEVTLIDGSVEILGKDDHHMTDLCPDQKAVYDRATGRIRIETVRSAVSKAWTEGWLVFDGMELKDIFERLSRLYNVKIRVKDMPGENLTAQIGRIRRTEYVNSILDDLRFVFDFDYYYTEDTILITSKK